MTITKIISLILCIITMPCFAFALESTAPDHYLAEDVNMDGIVCRIDYSLLRAHFYARRGTPRYLERADINRDGIINNADAFQLYRAIGRKSDNAFPNILVTSPTGDQLITTMDTCTIEGQCSEPLASFRVDHHPVQLRPDLSFSYDVALQTGENAITIKAVDPANNTTYEEINITRQQPVYEVPGGLCVEETEEGLLVSWNQSAGDITGYVLQKSENGIPCNAINVSSEKSEYHDSAVNAGVHYEYSIAAVYGAHTTEFSNGASLYKTEKPGLDQPEIKIEYYSLSSPIRNVNITTAEVTHRVFVNDMQLQSDGSSEHTSSIRVPYGDSRIKIQVRDLNGESLEILRTASRTQKRTIPNDLTGTRDSILNVAMEAGHNHNLLLEYKNVYDSQSIKATAYGILALAAKYDQTDDIQYRDRIVALLRCLSEIQNAQPENSDYGKSGLFYSEMVRNNLRAYKAEIRLEENALLALSLIFTKEYFLDEKEIRDLASGVLDQMDWLFFLMNDDIYLRWSPENGFSDRLMDQYLQPGIVLSALVAYSRSFDERFPVALSQINREYAISDHRRIIKTANGSLREHTFLQPFLDLEGLGAEALYRFGSNQYPINYSISALKAAAKHRELCHQQTEASDLFRSGLWGKARCIDPVSCEMEQFGIPELAQSQNCIDGEIVAAPVALDTIVSEAEASGGVIENTYAYEYYQRLCEIAGPVFYQYSAIGKDNRLSVYNLTSQILHTGIVIEALHSDLYRSVLLQDAKFKAALDLYFLNESSFVLPNEMSNNILQYWIDDTLADKAIPLSKEVLRLRAGTACEYKARILKPINIAAWQGLNLHLNSDQSGSFDFKISTPLKGIVLEEKVEYVSSSDWQSLRLSIDGQLSPGEEVITIEFKNLSSDIDIAGISPFGMDAPPPEPTDLLIENRSFGNRRRVYLNWQGNSHKYIIERSEDVNFQKGLKRIITVETNYTDCNLQEGDYYYRIRSLTDDPENGGAVSSGSVCSDLYVHEIHDISPPQINIKYPVNGTQLFAEKEVS